MKTDLFYYTGTGNSLWAARTLADSLGAAGSASLRRIFDSPAESRADAVGIVFPVHIWGVPRRVIAFVEALRIDPQAYCFALAVNAGQVAAALVQLEKLMRIRGLRLASGFGLLMPSNYIPWGGPGPEAAWRGKITAAAEKLQAVAAVVAKKEPRPMEKGPLWLNPLLTALNRLSFSRVPAMDKSFWVDEKCNGCGICKAICPCGNIDLAGGKPLWRHHCEQCLACLQWCPPEAIQFGKKTPGFERYRHPEVKLPEMLAGGEKTAGKG
ncbi:MAG: EFR1 family ferrodoxin [Deltaproteobacteria bacterium]|nr:EFR1 family ferrodoxin [Deltaproteobacteria bacterium]